MEGAFQVIFGILCWTSIIVLVVLGLGVIASMMGIFNFAHGEFLLLGGYTLYLFHIWGLPLWLGIVAAPFVVAIIGVVLERTIIHRFYAAPIVAMLGTYAIGVIIRETVRGLIDGLYLRVPAPLVGMFAVGDISISKWRVAAIVMTILVVAGSYLLLNRTSFGLRVRASLENPERVGYLDLADLCGDFWLWCCPSGTSRSHCDTVNDAQCRHGAEFLD